MQASRQPVIVGLRISGEGISDAGIRGVRERPGHVGKVRLGVRAVAGRSLPSERLELL